ncbi:siderophore ABC transporter substrate-binding protein [Mobilicoccus pelagius]|uniref:Putative ABC transporter substrate-binding protein n=1 Tax=Mobilicoccus pelagius NBRC 104925 TaxID=1089455 RepID=H5UUL5_9MICO|nr:ABC transporter substrate-binding protein [Mobilicoccus pelagius]GAB49423.1 putative ABC transporter substrate-binding protein [Mobilicoccus pelagius NBRC 104925]
MSRTLAITLSLTATLGLAACGSPTDEKAAATGAAASSSPDAQGTLTVASKGGDVQVPRNPQRVVALDNTSFETLQAFGITPVAAPKGLLPKDLDAWKKDPNVLDVGNHREPKLEVVAQARPDLIVGGKRFEKVTDDLQKLSPVVDLAPEVESRDYVADLKKQTTTIGEIFGRQADAKALNDALDASVAKAVKAAKATSGQTVFLANHNGGKIDNAAGRIGALLQPLPMTEVFGTTPNSESVHQDSSLSPETIAAKNPDVMIVMDRDAAVAKPGETVTPASRTIEAQKAWKNTTFAKNGDIVYLRDTFYTTEGIQAYTDAYTRIAETLQR